MMMENLLYDAKEDLPTTTVEWRVPEVKEETSKKNSLSVLQRFAASVAIVLALGIGGVTVFANMEMDIDPGEYGQWIEFCDVRDWESCQTQMKQRGFLLPESFGEYGFDCYTTTTVVKHGTTYWEALTNHVYNPISIQFDDNDWENKDGYTINVSVGTLEEDYWRGYFEYEKVDGVWVAKGATTSFEYDGFFIYGYVFEVESRESMCWRWIDENNGVGWAIYVPINSGLANEVDDVEVVKQIIDLNK